MLNLEHRLIKLTRSRIQIFLTEEINDAVIVTGKQSNQVFKKQHESCIDDAIC